MYIYVNPRLKVENVKIIHELNKLEFKNTKHQYINFTIVGINEQHTKACHYHCIVILLLSKRMIQTAMCLILKYFLTGPTIDNFQHLLNSSKQVVGFKPTEFPLN